MGRRPPQLGERKPRDPVREKRVKDAEWVINIKLVRDGTTLHELSPLVVVDSQLQNVGTLVERVCDETGGKYVTKPRRKR